MSTPLSSPVVAITNHSQKDREWADTGYIYLVSIQNHLSSWWIRVCTDIWLEGFSFPFIESLWPHISFFPALCRVVILEQDKSCQGQGYLLQLPEKQLGCVFPVVLLTNVLHHKRQNYCLPVIIFILEAAPNTHSFPLSLHKSKLYYLQCSPLWNW